MCIPPIVFDDNTDYDAVLAETKLYFSDFLINNKCRCIDKYQKTLLNSFMYINSADYLKAASELTAYKTAVEAAYLSLTCNC